MYWMRQLVLAHQLYEVIDWPLISINAILAGFDQIAETTLMTHSSREIIQPYQAATECAEPEVFQLPVSLLVPNIPTRPFSDARANVSC